MSSGVSPSVDSRRVRERLANVHDPELDRSIVDLEYVEAIRLEEERVDVQFVLPTAWCSPAFAWMMATGIRDEVGALPNVEDVHVELRDHMHGDQINRGVNERLPFQDVFEDADEDVAEVRHKLDRKARLVRQYHAVEHLLDAGLDPEQITELTDDDLDRVGDRIVVYLHDGSVGVSMAAEPILDYLEKAREVGVVTGPDGRLFAGPDENPIDPDEFESVRREGRLAKTNVDGQAAICSQLHEARNGVELNVD